VRCSPDHRWTAVKMSTAEPVQPIEAVCWRHVHRVESSSVIERAKEIYEEVFERERLQPWLIAGADDRDIWERTGLPTEVTRAYRYLFFDVSVFRDMFDKQLWVHRYQGTPEGLAYLQKAVLYGVEAIAHVMGAVVRLDPNFVVEQAMRETFFRGQALRHSRLGSVDAAAAHSLLKSAVENSQLLNKTRPANITDVMFKLKSREMTLSAEDPVLDGKILH